MRVLVACEFSGTVRRAFRDKGHDAWSCDVLPCEDGGEHIQGDVLEILSHGWDLMIAHPPCTYLTIAGATYFDRNRLLRDEAVEFFRQIQAAPISRIAIENPVPFLDVQNKIGKYDQIINPFQFGDPERKRICLWLKGLTELKPTKIVPVRPPVEYIRKTGKKAGQIYRGYFHQGKNAHARSRFFRGIAEAMAEQWG